jgi:hypothetical protein
MRKLFILLLFAPLALCAQVGEYRTDLAVGINGGYLMNKVSFTPTVPQLNQGGMTAGLTIRYTCEKYFSSICAITAEVNYSQMGWKENILDMENNPVYYYDDEANTNPLYYDRRINYIQVPVLARLGWGRERRGFQAFVQLGPQMGFFMSESTNTNIVRGQGTKTSRASAIVAQEDMPVEKKFDYGIVGGAGLEYSHPRLGHFLVEARYYFGLGNIFGNSKQDFFGKSNNGTIVVKMTYLFDIIRTKNDKIK